MKNLSNETPHLTICLTESGSSLSERADDVKAICWSGGSIDESVAERPFSSSSTDR